MTEQFDPKLVEQAARALYHRPPARIVPWEEAPRWVRDLLAGDALAVLAAVAPALMAQGAAAEVESFTFGICEQGTHVDFAVDADANLTCPFCRLESAEQERDTAYQRGMVEGARQVLAAVEARHAERGRFYSPEPLDSAREAVARIEKGETR